MMAAHYCPNCGGPMVQADFDYLAEYPGAPTHSCAHHLCRGRVWVDADGSVTVTRTLEQLVQEIHRRAPKQQEAASSAVNAA